MNSRKKHHQRQKLWEGTYDFAISPPFHKCIIPECHFTYITSDTLDAHVMLNHQDLREYYQNDNASSTNNSG